MAQISEHCLSRVHDLVPSNYEYRIEHALQMENCDGIHFIIRMKEIDNAELKRWLSDFEVKTKVDWIVRRTLPIPKQSQFNKYFVCHRNNYNKKLADRQTSRNKNTFCTAHMQVKVKLVTKSTKKRDKFVREGFPTCINVFWCHNHPLFSSESLSYRRTRYDVKQKFFELYNLGMTVPQALRFFRAQLELSADFEESMLDDAGVFPKGVAHPKFYEEWRKNTPEEIRIRSDFSILEEKISTLNDVKFEIILSELPFTVVLLSEIMIRCHEHISNASQTVFVDGTSFSDNATYAATYFYTVTSAGAFPLAVLITDNHSEECHYHAFDLLKNLLGDRGFFKKTYPETFITNDDENLRAALRKSWPNSRQFLSRYNAARNLWRWLNENSHGVEKEDRKIFMDAFKRISEASDESEASRKFMELLNLSQISKYVNFRIYVQNFWTRRREWLPCVRMHDYETRKKYIFEDTAARILQDALSFRCSKFNIAGIVEFFTLIFEEHFRKRLDEFSKGLVKDGEEMLRSVWGKIDFVSSKNDIVRLSDHGFRVPAGKKSMGYREVHTVFGLCNCDIGARGEFCKHQAAVLKFFDDALPCQAQVTQEDRSLAIWLLGQNLVTEQMQLDGAGVEQQLDADADAQHDTVSDEDSFSDTDADSIFMNASSARGSTSVKVALAEIAKRRAEYGQLTSEMNRIFGVRFKNADYDPKLLDSYRRFLKRAQRATDTAKFAKFLRGKDATIQSDESFAQSGENAKRQGTSISEPPAKRRL